VYIGKLSDGWHYTSNHLRVWNHAEIDAAMQYALDFGVPKAMRSSYRITLGVPGAGKTYAAVRKMAPQMLAKPNSVLYLGCTRASVKAALMQAEDVGIGKRVMAKRFMTVDAYLIHRKLQADYVVIDEAPADHIGKIDAIAAISGASLVEVYGDGCQVEYSPFVGGYVPQHAAPGSSVPEENYFFMPESHRSPRDVCAAWLHKYPAYYPCKCHADEKHERSTMSWRRIKSAAEVEYDAGTRYHAYRQDDKEELRVTLPFGKGADELRAKDVGGLATVHEDQGSTHKKVVTVRPYADYDKNQSAHNPSLFNKECYVLSDTTRHTGSYEYLTACAEQDGVIRAIARSHDVARLSAVDERRGIRNVKLSEMWA
jgi:hypothetical protein